MHTPRDIVVAVIDDLRLFSQWSYFALQQLGGEEMKKRFLVELWTVGFASMQWRPRELRMCDDWSPCDDSGVFHL